MHCVTFRQPPNYGQNITGQHKGGKMKDLIKFVVIGVVLAVVYNWCVENWRIGCVACWFTYPFIALACVAYCEKKEENKYV